MPGVHEPGVPGTQGEEENPRQEGHGPGAVAQAEEQGGEDEEAEEEVGEQGMPEEEGEDGRDQAIDLVPPEEPPVRVPGVEPGEPPAEEVVEDGEAEEEAEGGDARQGEGEGAGKNLRGCRKSVVSLKGAS